MMVVGQCSACGGTVLRPLAYHSTRPLAAYCERCGATERTAGMLPVVKMQPKEPARPPAKFGPHLMSR